MCCKHKKCDLILGCKPMCKHYLSGKMGQIFEGDCQMTSSVETDSNVENQCGLEEGVKE